MEQGRDLKGTRKSCQAQVLFFAQKDDQGASRGEDKGRTKKPRGQGHLGHDVYAVWHGRTEAGQD